MSDNSPRLDLPFILPSQAQKHVTHNEALRLLDALVQLAVEGFGAVTPPAQPAQGEVWAIGPGAGGAWVGQDGTLAVFSGNGWIFRSPRPGWIATLAGSAELRVWDGADWIVPGLAGLENLAGLGINTTSDATNRLAVAAPATLLTHEGDDHRLVINKATAGDTASLLWQSGWSGRAELGLAGDDDLHVKVSADGANWTEAMVIDASSGRASFPAGLNGVPERLSANRTFFVRLDGSDANDGLSDSAAGAFRTVQRAVDVAAGLYCGPFAVTVRIGAGSFAEGARLFVPGNGNLRLTLEGAGASATTISGTIYGVQVSGPCDLTLRDLRIAGASVTLWARYGARVNLRGTVELGTGTARLIGADNAAYVEVLSCILRIGVTSSSYLLFVTAGGHVYLGSGVSVVTTAPVTFSATVYSGLNGITQIVGSQVTWNEAAGAIQGTRYVATGNGVINTVGAGPSFIPGTIAGTLTEGGRYL